MRLQRPLRFKLEEPRCKLGGIDALVMGYPAKVDAVGAVSGDEQGRTEVVDVWRSGAGEVHFPAAFLTHSHMIGVR